MKHLLPILLASILIIGCKKDNTNPDCNVVFNRSQVFSTKINDSIVVGTTQQYITSDNESYTKFFYTDSAQVHYVTMPSGISSSHNFSVTKATLFYQGEDQGDHHHYNYQNIDSIKVVFAYRVSHPVNSPCHDSNSGIDTLTFRY